MTHLLEKLQNVTGNAIFLKIRTRDFDDSVNDALVDATLLAKIVRAVCLELVGALP